jgi:hypothetical protein
MGMGHGTPGDYKNRISFQKRQTNEEIIVCNWFMRCENETSSIVIQQLFPAALLNDWTIIQPFWARDSP